MKDNLRDRHKLSRRGFTQAVTGGSLVVGFNAVGGVWVTRAAAERGDPFEAIPPLQGDLRTDEAARSAYALDYGNVIHERPRAVLLPQSSADVAAIVRFAKGQRLRIAARGHGHQPFGQAQVEEGIVIDMQSMHGVHGVVNDEVSVDAGADWGSVVSAAFQRHMAPPVLTNYLRLTVGGTLSIGGVGVASLRHGAQVDQVRELEAVTGTGEVLSCSELEHPDLFHALLAGQGQCGVITRVRMRVITAPPVVREYTFRHADLATQLDNLRELARLGWADGLVAMLQRTPDGWVHVVQAVRSFTPPNAPDDRTLTNAARPHVSVQIHDVGYEEFANTTAFVETEGTHADLGLLLPASAAEKFLSEALPRLNASDLGGALGMRVFYWDRRVFTRRLFRLPEAAHCVYVAILREPATDLTMQKRALEGNRALFERARELGGTLYPFAALQLTRDEWRRHYAEQWSELVAAKRKYDPGDVIASGPDVLGPADPS